MVTARIDSSISTRKEEVRKRLSEAFGDRLKQNVPLASYTTFGIGGKADLLFTAAKPEELVFAIRTVRKLTYRFLILGGGSNVLVSDSGFRGLVIRNQCQRVLVNQNQVTCQSGALLNDVVNIAGGRCLSGLEFAAGIPGTVGGAIRGNAGAIGESVGDVLTKAVILTKDGEVKEVGKDFFQFAYRDSELKRTSAILLSATLGLEKQNQEQIEERIAHNLKHREESLPWKQKSAGCFFKNVVDGERRIAAGFLLDQIGAKEMREGDARVSAKHANILMNAGSARAADVRKLARKLKRKVKQEFDIDLEEEVVYIN